MDISKTRTSFYRRLYLAWLIDSGQATNISEIIAHTGMPRRTAQDTLAALAELDIQCNFAQRVGQRNNTGHYQINDWGPINKTWINNNIITIKEALNYP